MTWLELECFGGPAAKLPGIAGWCSKFHDEYGDDVERS